MIGIRQRFTPLQRLLHCAVTRPSIRDHTPRNFCH